MRSILYTNRSTLYFRYFLAANFLARLEKSSHMLSSSLYTVLQVMDKISTSMIDKRFNIHQTKYQFLYHHQMIVLPFDWST